MRAISTPYEELLTSRGGVMRRIRVSIKDSGGTLRDLTTYLGKDFVLSGSWGETVDDNGFDAEFELFRQDGKMNLSPYMTKSAANLGLAFPGSYSPLIEVGREVLVEWAIAPKGTPAASLVWVKGMRGKVADHDPTGGRVKFSVRGRYCDLLDAFIEEERVYAHADPADGDATKGCRLYKEGDSYAVNELVIPGDAKRNAHFYKVTSITTGIGGAEGTWPTGAGGAATFGGVTVTEKGATTITTGTPLETLLQQLADDNLTGAPTINTPASPSWLLKWWLQTRTGAWTAMRALVDQIGWDLRDVWHAGTSDLRFELRAVDRAKTTPDRTFGPGDRFRLRKLAKNLDGLRNRIRVWFYDSTDLDADNRPTRKSVISEDATSKTKYGTRFMEVSEAWDEKTGTGSNIDTPTEATAFADAMRDDLKEPFAEQECDFPFFPFVELGDLYRFTDDGKHYDVNVDLAVVGYRHRFTAGGGKSPTFRTTITCRGKPASGYERWLSRDAGRNAEIHLANLNNTFFTSMITEAQVGPGGAKMKAQQHFSKHAIISGFEFHLSKTTGFTPSATTLQYTGLSNDFQIPANGGDPGETYYGKIAPWHYNAQKRARGAFSEEFAMVPGYLRPKHINTEEFSIVGDTPLNGSFEAYSRAETFSVTPDQWDMNAGTWLTDIRNGPLKGGVDAKEGGRYLTWLATSVKTRVISKFFQVIGAHVYEFTAWVYRDTGDDDIDFVVDWNTSGKSPTSPLTITVDTGDLTSSAWNQVRQVVIAPADAAFCRINLGRSASTNNKFHVDAVKLKWLGEKWLDVQAAGSGNQVPVFANSWIAGKGTTAPGVRPENGRGWCKGAIGGGTVGSTAIQFCNGLFPPHTVRAPVMDGAGALREVEISSGGALKLLAGSNTVVYLDHVSWPLS